MEKIKCPEDHIAAVLERAKTEYISKAYKIDSWENDEDFLEKLAYKTGKLLKVSILPLLEVKQKCMVYHLPDITTL